MSNKIYVVIRHALGTNDDATLEAAYFNENDALKHCESLYEEWGEDNVYYDEVELI